MKSTMLAFAVVACALTAPIVSAQQMSAPEGSEASMDKQLSQMQEHMKEMQQQLAKLRATTDPNERRTLVQDHMHSMRAYMNAMHSMSGPGGPGMMGGPGGPEGGPGMTGGPSGPGMMPGPAGPYGGPGMMGGSPEGQSAPRPEE